VARTAEAGREDAGTTRTIEDGVSPSTRPFAERSRRSGRGARGARGSDFFESCGDAVTEVYSDQPALAAGRLRGTVVRKGGYIDRRNDLDWLPTGGRA